MDDVDPTRIDIKFDPMRKRMEGIAYHGNTPFSVPYISQISKHLFQGGCENGLILPNEITFVLSLYPWEKYTLHDNAERLEVKMYDSLDQAFGQVDDLAGVVISRLEAEENVLVHCQAGLNRSSLIAARVLMLMNDWDADTAIKTIRENRSPACLCNPAFEEHLRSLDT